MKRGMGWTRREWEYRKKGFYHLTESLTVVYTPYCFAIRQFNEL